MEQFKVGWFGSQLKYRLDWLTDQALRLCNLINVKMIGVEETPVIVEKEVPKWFGKGTRVKTKTTGYAHKIIIEGTEEQAKQLKLLTSAWVLGDNP